MWTTLVRKVWQESESLVFIYADDQSEANVKGSLFSNLSVFHLMAYFSYNPPIVETRHRWISLKPYTLE